MNFSSGNDSNNSFLALAVMPFELRLYGMLRSIYSSMLHIIEAGLLPTTTLSGIDLVTTLPAVTSTLLPIVTPGIISEQVPMYT